MPDAKDSLQVGSCVNLYDVVVSMVQKSIGSCHVLPWGCVLSEPLMDFRFSSIYCAWTAYKTSLGSGQGAVLPGRIDGHGTRNLSPCATYASGYLQNAMIEVKTRYFPATSEGIPAFALQITKLIDSYMLWIGVTDRTAEDVEGAAEKGKLSKDWVCAMPPRFVCTIQDSFRVLRLMMCFLVEQHNGVCYNFEQKRC